MHTRILFVRAHVKLSVCVCLCMGGEKGFETFLDLSKHRDKSYNELRVRSPPRSGYTPIPYSAPPTPYTKHGTPSPLNPRALNPETEPSRSKEHTRHGQKQHKIWVMLSAEG
jgi:hypothetical protein